jgi:hypothetical protein
MNDIENTILLYLEGDLTKSQMEEVEQNIAKKAEWKQVFEETQHLLGLMDNVQEEQPSVQLSTNFYSFLEAEKEEISANNSVKVIRLQPRRIWQMAAAAIGLLLVGFFAGSYFEQSQQLMALQNQMNETQEMVIEMLKEESASERMKAVSYSLEQEPNDHILNALIQTMILDDNLNVRIKAIEGLQRFPQKEQVANAMIKLLQKETDVEVQMMLIEALTAMQSQEAINEFQNIIEQDSIQDFVKNKAADGLQILL